MSELGININNIEYYNDYRKITLLKNRTFQVNRINTGSEDLYESEKQKENHVKGTIETLLPHFSSGIPLRVLYAARFLNKRSWLYSKAYIDSRNKIIVKHKITEDSFAKTAREYFDIVEYFSLKHFIKEIKRVNNIKSNTPVKGKEITIPGIVQMDIDNMKPRKVGPNFAPKGIYINGNLASSGNVKKLINQFQAHGGNTVIFDVKDCDGIIRFATESELANSIEGAVNPSIPIKKLLYHCKKKGIHIAARISVFRDIKLARSKKEFKLKYNGKDSPKEKNQWVDPTIDEVINYNIELAVELAQTGVDEINFDYIRFPALEDVETNGFNRIEVITKFLKKAQEALKPYGVRISVDVFASTAWPSGEKTINTIGQNLKEIAKHVDAIYLMAYPSHFIYPQLGNTADKPSWLIKKTCEHALELLKDSNVSSTLFYQAFKYKNEEFPYGPDYVLAQLKAGYKAGMTGFLLWNVRGSYEEAFEAIEKFQEYIEAY